LEFRRPLKSSPLLEKIISDFRSDVLVTRESVMREEMLKASAFVGSYSV
jgi:hypothetical protein